MPSTFVAEQRKLSGVFRILLGYTANQEPGGSRRTAKVDGIGLPCFWARFQVFLASNLPLESFLPFSI
jgi:hypothetical protein